MRIRWRGLELPGQVLLDESVSTDSYGRFTIEPFEQGFGTTIGNSLRRVLLSSLEGAAITAIKIDGVPHEFGSIDGVLEDVTDIVLNVKGVILQYDEEQPIRLQVQRNTTGDIRAKDIECPTGVEIKNPDHHIATLTSNIAFRMELVARTGRGYATAGENRTAEQEIGVIPVDSVFSPVLRVRYRSEDMRVDDRTNYNRLILEVWTKGTIAPADALVEAGLILRKHLNPFVMYYDMGDHFAGPPQTSIELPVGEDTVIDGLLDKPVAALNLSVRSSNCLEAARISTLRELVSKTESDLLRVRSFGKTSLDEVQAKLSELNLSLGYNPGGTDTSTVSENVDAGGESVDAASSESDSSVPGSSGPMEVFTMGD